MFVQERPALVVRRTVPWVPEIQAVWAEMGERPRNWRVVFVGVRVQVGRAEVSAVVERSARMVLAVICGIILMVVDKVKKKITIACHEFEIGTQSFLLDIIFNSALSIAHRRKDPALSDQM